MEAFLLAVLPRLFQGRGDFEVFDFGDKHSLLAEAPGRLKSLTSWMPEDWRIVVLVDEDRQDCMILKASLEAAAMSAGFRTRSTHPKDFHVLNRVVVEELEAWIFGDPEALHAAFPRIPATVGSKAKYRDPDSITGGTWEALERELQSAGYFKAGLPKRHVAATVGAHLLPQRNRSRSFHVFWNALTEMLSAD